MFCEVMRRGKVLSRTMRLLRLHFAMDVAVCSVSQFMGDNSPHQAAQHALTLARHKETEYCSG